jgi:hypothetical protein
VEHAFEVNAVQDLHAPKIAAQNHPSG